MPVAVATLSPAAPSPPVDPALLLRPGLVAGWLGVTTRTPANWAAAGKVPFHRTEHGHLRFVAAELAPAVAAMGRVVPPLPASIAQRQPKAVLAVVGPPDSFASAAEPDQGGEDGQPSGQGRAVHTPTASVQVGQFLVRQRFYGACTQATAELFFDHGREPGHLVRQRHQAAKAICALCPILWECRLVGRADPTLVGIWGGETEADRHLAHRTPLPDGPARRREPGGPPPGRRGGRACQPRRPGRRRPSARGLARHAAARVRPLRPRPAVRPGQSKRLRREVNPHGHHQGGQQRPRPAAAGAARRGPARRPGLGDHSARPRQPASRSLRPGRLTS